MIKQALETPVVTWHVVDDATIHAFAEARVNDTKHNATLRKQHLQAAEDEMRREMSQMRLPIEVFEARCRQVEYTIRRGFAAK